ncbi:MAG: hypothetical protein JXP34_14010 [Planctomycetes bacterium]|nr:hypothetical protein [Planctomycetota bacterium]
MSITIGTIYIGTVDAYEKQGVRTKFFMLGLPLFPLKSSFFVAPGRGFDIPLDKRSVGVAYLRWYLGLGGFLLAFAGLVQLRKSGATAAVFFVAAAIALAVWAISAFKLGKLTGEARIRAALLHQGCGLSADPSLVPKGMKETIGAKLREALRAHGAPEDPEHWSKNAPEAELRPIVYTLAAYSEGRDPAARTWRDVAARILHARAVRRASSAR